MEQKELKTQEDQIIEHHPFVHFLDRIVIPQYQVIALFITAISMFIISDKGLKKQIPLEHYPIIKPITAEKLNEWGGEPATIQVGFQINNVPKFKMLEDEFSIVGNLWFLFDPELVSINTISQFSFENQITLEKSEPEVKMIKNMVLAEFDIRLTFNSELSHQSFPLDNHRLYLNLVNEHISPNEALFKCDQSEFIISKQVFIPEWAYKNLQVFTGYTEYILDTNDTQKNALHPKVLFAIDFYRAGLRHVFIMLLPLFLICAVGMMSIGAQRTIGGKALDINVAGAASIIAYRFVIESMSPKVSYLMIADHIFIFFLIFACIQLIYSKITYQQPPRATWIIARGILFFLFYVGFIILWFYLIFIWAPRIKTDSAPDTKDITLNVKETFYPDFTLSPDAKRRSFSIGLINDLSRANRDFGRQIKNGINTALAWEQKNNILPITLALHTEDNESSLSKINDILNSANTKYLFCSFGENLLPIYIKFIEKADGFLLFPFSGSKQIRNKNFKKAITFRASYLHQGEALALYAVQELQSHRIFIMYEDSPFGIEYFEGSKNAFEKLNFPESSIASISYNQHDISFEKQIEKFKISDIDTVIFFASGNSIVEFINQLGIEYLLGKNLVGPSHINQSRYSAILAQKGLEFTTCNIVPNPKDTRIQMAKEFQDAMNHFNAPHGGAIAFEAFINTEILLHILNKIEGDITAEKIVQVASTFKSYDLKGITLDFNPETNQLSPFVWIETPSGTWIKHKMTTTSPENSQKQSNPPTEQK